MQQNQDTNYVDAYQPPQDSVSADAIVAASPAVAPTDSASATTSPTTSPEQPLEEQNIFELLGVLDGTDEQKETFLDELQQVIWEDFLENDVEMLLTQEEMTQMKQILEKEIEETAKQEETIIFLEKLIPDLEAIMLEKALELKEDMVRERLSGLRDFFGNDAEKLAQLDQVEAMMNQHFWADAAAKMNALTAR